MRELLAADSRRVLKQREAELRRVDKRLVEIEADFHKMPTRSPNTLQNVAWYATGGLLRYRVGDLSAGRYLYGIAADLAAGGEKPMQALVYVNWAHEEAVALTQEAHAKLNEARDQARGVNDPAVAAVLSEAERALVGEHTKAP